MDLSGISNASLFFNPTLGKSNAGFTGLSDHQIFYNPSVGRAPLDLDYSKLTDDDLLKIQGQSLTYSNKGLLFSSGGASSLQASYGLMDQFDLLNKQYAYNSMSKDILESYFASAAASEVQDEQGIDMSA